MLPSIHTSYSWVSYGIIILRAPFRLEFGKFESIDPKVSREKLLYTLQPATIRARHRYVYEIHAAILRAEQ